MNSLEIPESITVQDVVEQFFSGRSEDTIRAYKRDLMDFAELLGYEVLEALELLISQGPGIANLQVEQYKASMLEKGLAPATINRRISAIRSIVKLARKFGKINWALDVENVPHKSYRDTAGPSAAEVKRLIEAAGNSRDRAIVRLLYDLALRRIEVHRLDIEDVSLEKKTITIYGKGKREKSLLTLPDVTAQALHDLIQEREVGDGPLFVNHDRARKGNRLTPVSINRIVKKIGDKADVRVTAHGLRHSSITAALDLTNGDVRSVRLHSRHAKIETVLLYDDNRLDLAGQVAAKVAEGV